MDFEQLVSAIVNNGAAVGCLIYFMVYNSKQAEKTQQILKSLEDSIQELVIIVRLLQQDKQKEGGE